MTTRSDTQFDLNIYDELLLRLDQPSHPLGLQLEVRKDGHFDAERLQQALLGATAKHPMGRARLVSGDDATFRWQIAPLPERVALKVVPVQDDEELASQRNRFHSQPLPLLDGLPFRALLAQGEDSDLLLLNMSNVVTDGVGLYSFLMSTLRLYSDAARDLPEPDLALTRAAAIQTPPDDGLQRLGGLMQVLGSTFKPPARIAASGGEELPGFGFMPVRFNSEHTRNLQQLRRHGATINDVLITALHLAIQRWNDDHQSSTGRIDMIMPMNTRAEDERAQVASNLSLWVNVNSRDSERVDFDTLLAAVAAQTRQLKERTNLTTLATVMHELHGLPQWLRGGGLDALLPLTSQRLTATTVLSNLGAAPPDDAATLESLGIRELWFSPPCRPPQGLSLGTATLGGQLHLCFRYPLQQFDSDSAWAFAEIFLEILQQGR